MPIKQLDPNNEPVLPVSTAKPDNPVSKLLDELTAKIETLGGHAVSITSPIIENIRNLL